jgi:2-polyprenyl-3-methyl-5-hydroxy-6-metoxy-1,4-benzoquinol methylase
VLEIGCGGGDNLLYLANWAAQNNYQIQFTGVDLKKECIDYALSQCGAFSNINYIHSDYRDLTHSPTSYDIIFSSLFCHHFTDNELKEIVEFKKQKSKLGYFINDLHRHPVAYYSIQFLTCLFSKSPLVKNDAPLSVLRGFKLKELRQICGKVVHINWKWAFRWLVIYKHEPK